MRFSFDSYTLRLLDLSTELETEITELEGTPEPTNLQRARLAELKAELSRISKKKEEYVEAHPEQRGLVYKRRRETKENGEGSQAPAPPGKVKRNLFKKNGLPRHPERSVYYDPIMNPFGMPPPGMPYVERGKSIWFGCIYKFELMAWCSSTAW